MAGGSGILDVERALALYDANRFRDAHDVLRPAWPPLAGLRGLTVPELVLGARVALRLGAMGLAEWLLQQAGEREPESPYVRIWGRWGRRRPWSLLEQLDDMEREPDLPTEDPALQASWLGSAATAYSRARMFSSARACLDRARGLGVERAWLAACEADFHLDRDEWEEGLAHAETAWERSPGMPAAASVLGRALAAAQGPEAAAQRLLAVASEGQSYETLLCTVWHATAWVELLGPGPERDGAGCQILAVLARAREAAMLADLRTMAVLARVTTDLGLVLGDHALMDAWAGQGRSPFYSAVARSLRERPQGARCVVQVRPVRQTWNACLPAAVATAQSGLGVQVDVAGMTSALTYGGTATWRARQWLRERGQVVSAFVVRPLTARSLLAAGVPFVVTLTGSTMDHAVAAVGYDERSGLLLYDDPSTPRRGALLLESFCLEEGGLGPRGLAAVPAGRSGDLACIPEEDARPMEDYLDFEETLQTRGRTEALALARARRGRHPDSAVARRMEAVAAGLEGDLGRALPLFEALAAENPGSLLALRDLLETLQRTRNTARTQAVLREVVEQGRLPVLRAGEQPWRYPPPAFVVRYADYLGLSEEGAAQAEELLLSALRRSPFEAGGYHVLGDVRSRRDRLSAAVLPLRVAASLEDENEHYARGAAEALRRCGETARAEALLRERAGRLGERLGGGGPLVTLAEALDEFGEPGRAQEAMAAAQAMRPQDGALQASASRFWVRQGRWDLAGEALERAAATASAEALAATRTVVTREAGRWREALEPAATWLREAHESPEARSTWLGLLALRDGRPAAMAQARAWVDETPGDEILEDLLHGQLMEAGFLGEAERRVESRLARNPQDAWAWREVGHHRLRRAEGLGAESRREALDHAAAAVERARLLAPQVPATLVLQARLAEGRGDREGAAALLLQAVDHAPEEASVPPRLVGLTDGLSDERAEELVEGLEELLPRSAEPLHGARGLALAVAGRLGFPRAEIMVERLAARHEGDPRLVEAHADLLLHHGEGRSSAGRAVELLLPALEHYPHDLDLRFSLAHAYGVLGRSEDERAQFAEILRRRPLNGAARRSLALSMAGDGDVEGAVALLREGLGCNPLDGDVTRALVRVLGQAGETAQAVEVLERALALDPFDTDLRAMAVEGLLDAGRANDAEALARAGVAVGEPSAEAWTLVAQTLLRHPGHSDAAEIERFLRSALAADAAGFRAADLLAEILAGQGRYAGARSVLEEQAPLLRDLGPTQARLAWLHRREGHPALARRAMAETVQAWPRSRWGWNELFDWLVEDQAWDEARTVLAELPPQAAGDPELRARRLEVLERAGTVASSLAPQWQALLADYPEHENLALRRFDRLVEAGERKEAEVVLQTAARHHPRSSYLLARAVRLSSLQERWDEAVEAASTLWNLPGDDELWPEGAAWDALASAGQERLAVDEACRLAHAGGLLRRVVYERMLDRLSADREAGVEERLVGLLDVAVGGMRDGGIRVALVLRALARVGAGKRVEAFRQGHEALCRESTPIWQELGTILVDEAESDWGRARGGRKVRDRAREALAGWRGRQGLQGWGMATYLAILRAPLAGPLEPEYLNEALAASRHALDTLTHDGCARVHAVTAGEALLRLGRDDEFQVHLERFGGLLGDEGERWFMPPRLVWAGGTLLRFGELLSARDDAAVGDATAGLRRALCSWTHPWVRDEWLQRLIPRVGPWQRRRHAFSLGFRAGWLALVGR